MVSYLDKYLTGLEVPMDVITLFNPLSTGQQHHLNRALRGLFNFCEITGFDKSWLDTLRKAIPKDQTGIDLKVPEEQDICNSMKRISGMEVKYGTLWDLCLDSGLRLIETVHVMNSFDPRKLQRIGNICVYELAAFRGSKQAYYALFTGHTFELLRDSCEEVGEGAASKYYQNHKLINPKYLRKFAFDTMTSEQLNIPESVADFIEGRVPKTVGARHYMKLKRQAVQYYPRYAEYLATLRSKAGLEW